MQTTKTICAVSTVFYGSHGGTTRRLMAALGKIRPHGRIAAQLFRAQKASSRAKKYRGGIRRSDGQFNSYRELAYDAKQNALQGLCAELDKDASGLRWGWAVDSSQARNRHVLYVELPNGQVSFHSPTRLVGPDYEDPWDGMRASESRIIEFCQGVLGGSLGWERNQSDEDRTH